MSITIRMCVSALGAARWADFPARDGHRERDEVRVGRFLQRNLAGIYLGMHLLTQGSTYMQITYLPGLSDGMRSKQFSG